MEVVREVWTRRQRRSAVPTAVIGRGGEGRMDDAVLESFDVEEERGTGLEVHLEDAEEGLLWRACSGGGRRGGAGV
jgi:hypothetical protein